MTTPHASASLYVGDLQSDVTEALLFEIFKAVGPVASIRVCRDAATRRSLGYAYVNFHSVVDAERALDTLNYTPIKTRPCRIMWSHRDPSLRKSGVGNVFIKNLDKSIDNKALYDTFSTFGNILSCKVALDETGSSKGYGFIHFETQDAAEQAITKLNQMLVNGKQVYVGPFIPKKDLQKKFTNVYVKNLDLAYDEVKLQETFAVFGIIQNAHIMRDEEGKSKGFGFVNFKTHEDAQKAVEDLNGKQVGANILYVGRAQKKAEREAELKKKRREIMQERLNKFQGVNLYVKNLDDSIDDEKLRTEFSQFGAITSAKVMRDDKTGTSKGFGFVCFKTPEESTKAVAEMNGRMIGSKPIYVAHAQRKEVRRAHLEAQHAQRGLRMQAAAPGMPAPGGIPFASPMFYPGTIGASMAPQGQRLVYPGQMVPRPRGWGPPHQMPNYVVPVAQRQPRRQGGQRGAGLPPGVAGAAPAGAPAGHRAGAPAGPAGAVVPGAAGTRGRFKFTANVRNQVPPEELAGAEGSTGVPAVSADPAIVGMGPMGLAPLGVVHLPASGDVLPHIPTHGTPGVVADLSALAAIPQDDRKQILGDNLFAMIQRIQPALAPKITGMLLESLEHPELVGLLSSEEALNLKIAEAMEVLSEHKETSA